MMINKHGENSLLIKKLLSWDFNRRKYFHLARLRASTRPLNKLQTCQNRRNSFQDFELRDLFIFQSQVQWQLSTWSPSGDVDIWQSSSLTYANVEGEAELLRSILEKLKQQPRKTLHTLMRFYCYSFSWLFSFLWNSTQVHCTIVCFMTTVTSLSIAGYRWNTRRPQELHGN